MGEEQRVVRQEDAELNQQAILSPGQPLPLFQLTSTATFAQDFAPPLIHYKIEHSLSYVSINNKPSRRLRIFTVNDSRVLNGLSHALVNGELFLEGNETPFCAVNER